MLYYWETTSYEKALGVNVELRWESFLIGLSWDAESDTDFSVYLGPLSLTWPFKHGLPANIGRDWYVGQVAGWNIYACINTNIWAVGTSWSREDIGIYAGPINAQFEKHGRG
jgi:hypothetical protein